ncbi:MAG: hypothetical protein JNK85_14680 [Verrucomicrobiales bacterium]|nr:hypothetical protein [Verrucomicrobiales bacterium]
MRARCREGLRRRHDWFLLWLMRALVVTLAALSLSLLTGCRSQESSVDSQGRTLPASAKGGGLGPEARTATATTNPSSPATVVLPASGRVHTVNAGLRFVVIDYTLGGTPALQSLLDVFRGNERVGQVRLTGPERNGFVAADVTEGFLQVGDEVRLR